MTAPADPVPSADVPEGRDGANAPTPSVRGDSVPGVLLYPGLEYWRVGARSLLLDLYLPIERPVSIPLVLWIDGGGWGGGSRGTPPEGLSPEGAAVQIEAPADAWLNADRGGDLVPAWLVRRGYAVASIDYRLSDEAIFPAQIEDCAAALRWLADRAGRYGIDTDRIGLWGISAGGHLAALLGTAGDPDGGAVESTRVRAVCVYCGPTDFAAMVPLRGREAFDWTLALISGLLGGPVETRPELAARANPVSHVSPGAPPFLLVYGEKDPLVPPEQGRSLHEALSRNGVASEFRVIREGGHVFISPETDAATERFFRRHLMGDDGGPGSRPGLPEQAR